MASSGSGPGAANGGEGMPEAGRAGNEGFLCHKGFIVPADALGMLRGTTDAVLCADERPFPRRFVLDGVTGRPVVAAPPLVDEVEQLVLHVPDEGEDSLQLLVEHQWLDPDRDEAADRFLIHHGKPDTPRLAALDVLAVKLAGVVLEVERVQRPNPLLSIEPATCKKLNADKEVLARICRVMSGRTPTEPTLVGIDPHGMWVRTRTGPLRLAFTQMLDDPQQAAAFLNEVITRAG